MFLSAALTEAQCNLFATSVRGRRLKVWGFAVGRFFIGFSWFADAPKDASP